MDLPMTLVAKLAGAVVHAQELLSPDGHDYDRVALEASVNDAEVVAWVESLGPLAPRKRTERP